MIVQSDRTILLEVHHPPTSKPGTDWPALQSWKKALNIFIPTGFRPFLYGMRQPAA